MPETRIFENRGLQVVILDGTRYRFEKPVDNEESILISCGQLPVLLGPGGSVALTRFVTVYEEVHGSELRKLLTGRG